MSDLGTATPRACWCGAAFACHAGQFELQDRSRYTLVRCEGCGVFALDPQPSDEQLGAHYSPEYYGSSRRKFVRPIAGLVSLFQGGRARLAGRHMPAGGRVLDIGCGNGGFLLQMKQRGFDVEGTEWTADSAARVPPEIRDRVHIGDLLCLDLPDRSYDLVTLWHVFEHLRQPQETLLSIHRLLKPGGGLLMSMPNAESRQATRFRTDWFHWDPPRHLFGFGPRSIETLLNSTGFKIESLSTFSLEQNPFGYIQSWLNERGHQRDRLYDLIKGTPNTPTAARIADLAWLAALAAPAALVSTIESWGGRGATMTLHATALAEAGTTTRQ